MKAVKTEDRMARRLGLTEEAPVKVESISGLDPADEELLDEFCFGEDADTVDLEDWE